MHDGEHETLAGRIDGIGQALLRLTAELEMVGVIDGSRVSAGWTEAADGRQLANEVHRSARATLLQLAATLDDARQARLSRWMPG